MRPTLALALALLTLPTAALAGRTVKCVGEDGREIARFQRHSDLARDVEDPKSVPWARIDFTVERAAAVEGAFTAIVLDAEGEQVREEELPAEVSTEGGDWVAELSLVFPDAKPLQGRVQLVAPDGATTCAVDIDLFENRMKKVR